MRNQTKPGSEISLRDFIISFLKETQDPTLVNCSSSGEPVISEGMIEELEKNTEKGLEYFSRILESFKRLMLEECEENKRMSMFRRIYQVEQEALGRGEPILGLRMTRGDILHAAESLGVKNPKIVERIHRGRCLGWSLYGEGRDGAGWPLVWGVARLLRISSNGCGHTRHAYITEPLD